MPVLAMSFACVFSRRGIAAKNIGSVGNRFKMLGIYTVPNTAQVIENHATWNLSYQCFVDNTVAHKHFPTDTDLGIAVSHNESCWYPASVWIGGRDSCKYPICCGFWFRCHVVDSTIHGYDETDGCNGSSHN